MAQNCWDIKKCNREIGGSKTTELGVCVAAADTKHDGSNHGVNGGRICWAIAGTLCGGKVQGTMAAKMGNCTACEVFKTIKSEEGENFKAF